MSAFTFSKCNIKEGEQVEFYYKSNEPSGKLFTVVDYKHVEYNGELCTLTAVARDLIGNSYHVAGPKDFKYKGEWLNDIRKRLNK